jgi:hypothetical protein
MPHVTAVTYQNSARANCRPTPRNDLKRAHQPIKARDEKLAGRSGSNFRHEITGRFPESDYFLYRE